MNSNSLNRKKEKIFRAYELVLDYRLLNNGHMKEQNKPSKIEFLSKWVEFQFLPYYFGQPPNWRMFFRSFSGKRTLPDFCVIGPIKSGTSDLAVSLMLHPNILPPISKEFASSDPEEWRMFYPTERQKNLHTKKYGLALSPFFIPCLHQMELAHNLSSIDSNKKVVIILRDPVKRFYSHWKWEVLHAGKQRAQMLPFLNTFQAYVEKSLSVFPVSPMFTACGFQPLQTSIYWKSVQCWLEYFGKDNVLVLDVGQYFLNKNSVLREIHDFVGLPPFDMPIFENKVNENPIKLPPPDEESIAKLKEFFEPHNQKLWKLINKKFDW